MLTTPEGTQPSGLYRFLIILLQSLDEVKNYVGRFKRSNRNCDPPNNLGRIRLPVASTAWPNGTGGNSSW